MKNVLLAVVAGLTLVGVPQTALACGRACHVAVKRVAVVAAVHHERVIVADFVAVVPLVSVGPAVNYQSPPDAETVRLRERVAFLEGVQAGKQQAGSAAPAPAPAPPPGQPVSAAAAPAADGKHLAVLTASCASCHTGATAKKGFKIFEAPGKLAALTDRQIRDILKAAKNGTMPPGKPLADDKAGDLLDLLD